MIRNRTVKSIVGVTVSNAISIVAGVIVGFIIPKILSIEDYGYHKTFTLYTSYMGLFSLGIADGIVLKYGRYDYDELRKEQFRAYFKWYMIVHIILCFLMVCLSFLVKGELPFILRALAVNTIIINEVGYFQQISQITQRFKEYSARKIIQSVGSIAVVFLCVLIWRKSGRLNYRLYVTLSIAFSFALAAWYISTYKDIIVGKSISLCNSRKDIILFSINGFPLLIANLCSTLILNLDRQFVSALFSTSEYAVYAFAYNMLSLVTVATSAVSTVIFPALKRSSGEGLRSNYAKLIGIMLVFVYFSLIVYFPLNMLIKWYLPKYVDSLPIFRIIFPGLGISSCITVVMHNYYKVLGKNIDYFKKCIMVLCLSGFANTAAYHLFHTTASISIASIITMMVWFVSMETMFVHEYKIKRIENIFYITLMGISFYWSTSLENIFISGLLYIGAFCIVTIMIKRNIISEIVSIIKNGD